MIDLTSKNLMQITQPLFCAYYQAIIKREECWLMTAALRSFEHMSFDRTLDKEKSLFEFFVAPDFERQFVEIMHYFEARGIVSQLQKLPNRLAEPDAKV